MYHHNFRQNTVYIIIRSAKFIQWELTSSQKNHILPAKKQGGALQHLPLFQFFVYTGCQSCFIQPRVLYIQLPQVLLPQAVQE